MTNNGSATIKTTANAELGLSQFSKTANSPTPPIKNVSEATASKMMRVGACTRTAPTVRLNFPTTCSTPFGACSPTCRARCRVGPGLFGASNPFSPVACGDSNLSTECSPDLEFSPGEMCSEVVRYRTREAPDRFGNVGASKMFPLDVKCSFFGNF
jgi:hypothetical protein